MKKFVAWVMSNFEAMWYIFEAESAETVLAKLADSQGEYAEDNLVDGVKLLEFLPDKFKMAVDAVKRYKDYVKPDTGDDENYKMTKEWLESFHYKTVTDEHIQKAQEMLETGFEGAIDENGEVEIDKDDNEVRTVLDMYFNVFCLGEYATRSVEMNVAMEIGLRKVRGKNDAKKND